MSDTTAATTSTTSSTTVQLQTITVPEGPRFIARVKWFDNTLSYGFATVTSGEHTGRDIFVHQSNILTLAQGIYRTLRMGEYIEFNIEESADNSTHRYQAIAVTGPGAGQLMCESNPRRHRFQSRGQQPVATSDSAAQQSNGTEPRQQRPPRNNRQNGGSYRHRHAPIQVVVEYPNPPRQQRRPRQPRQNVNNQVAASASAAANIAATLAAGN
jgi:cold shock CspA family protein